MGAPVSHPRPSTPTRQAARACLRSSRQDATRDGGARPQYLTGSQARPGDQAGGLGAWPQVPIRRGSARAPLEDEGERVPSVTEPPRITPPAHRAVLGLTILAGGAVQLAVDPEAPVEGGGGREGVCGRDVW